MASFKKIFSFLFTTAFFAVALYILAAAFGLLPEQYAPSVVFAQQIKDSKAWLAADAKSNSLTAGVSKKIDDYLNNKGSDDTDDKTVIPEEYNPLQKAQKTIQQYQNNIDQQKKQLDEL